MKKNLQGLTLDGYNGTQTKHQKVRKEAGMKVEVSDVVMTRWDDSVRPIKAVVLEEWRGHRGMKYKVQMKDGTFEEISEDQIIRKAGRG